MSERNRLLAKKRAIQSKLFHVSTNEAIRCESRIAGYENQLRRIDKRLRK